MKTIKEIEEHIKGKDDHWGCYKMISRELKNMNEAQILSSIHYKKNKKHPYYIYWFIIGFLCGILSIWLF